MKAVKLKSGSWRIQLYIGKDEQGRPLRKSFTADTKAQVEYMASEYKRNMERMPKARNVLTLRKALTEYINAKSNVLSPATIRGYNITLRNRFKDVMDSDIRSINWQKAINEEAGRLSPKTVRNDWALVRVVLIYHGYPAPEITLPQVVRKPLPYLTDSEISVFLKAIEGHPCEMMALLGLHSLRRSELLAVRKEDCKDGQIIVSGAVVPNINGEMVYKDTNKNTTSNRSVPIFIDRLSVLIESAPEGRLITEHPMVHWREINKICKENNLPEVGIHGLRRSFASLGYKLGLTERQIMAIGGWADFNTIHKFYIQLSQKDVLEGTDAMRKFYESEKARP